MLHRSNLVLTTLSLAAAVRLDLPFHGRHFEALSAAKGTPDAVTKQRIRWILATSGPEGRSELIDGGRDVGLGAFGSRVSVAGTIIEGVTPTVSGIFGDGIDVLSYSDAPGTLTVTSSRIAATSRAGVASFSAEAVLRDVHFECVALPLNGQDIGQGSFDIRDEGGNRCSCNGEETVCKVLTGELAAPEPPTAP